MMARTTFHFYVTRSHDIYLKSKDIYYGRNGQAGAQIIPKLFVLYSFEIDK